MTPNRGRIVCPLTALLIGLAASGCYIPGGGWTMRTGVDLRRYKKPSAFVELVDTRWDEFNRVAEINSMTALIPAPLIPAPLIPAPLIPASLNPAPFIPAPSTAAPAAFTPGAGPGLMEGIPVPPASDPGSPTSDPTPPEPRFPGNPTGGNPTGGEPSRLPGAADAPASTPTRDAPTARRSSLDDPPMAAPASDDATTDVTAAAASAPASKPSRRPMASRLFSRPQ